MKTTRRGSPQRPGAPRPSPSQPEDGTYKFTLCLGDAGTELLKRFRKSFWPRKTGCKLCNAGLLLMLAALDDIESVSRKLRPLLRYAHAEGINLDDFFHRRQLLALKKRPAGSLRGGH
jgi:hypothetical protein